MSSWMCRRIPFFPNFGAISIVSFSTSTPKISIFHYLVNQHDFSPKFADFSSSLFTNFIDNPQNADSVLNFLKEIGFSKNQMEVVVRREPWVLSTDLERTIKPKIEVFQELGLHSAAFTDVLSASPRLLRSSTPDRIRLSIVGLKNVLGPHADADLRRLLKKFGPGCYPEDDLDRKMVPNVEYLRSLGVCSLHIAHFVCRFPWVFQNNQEKFKGFVQTVDEMGVERESKTFLYAVSVMHSMIRRATWDNKVQFFRDLGFSDQNILTAFRAYPKSFTVSEGKIEEVTKLLLSVEGFSISDIARDPRFFNYSVEKRLKPRIRVLKALVSKNLLKKMPWLAACCEMTDANFTKKYVIPYSDELGDLVCG